MEARITMVAREIVAENRIEWFIIDEGGRKILQRLPAQRTHERSPFK